MGAETSKNTFEEINNHNSDDTIIDTNLDKNSNIKNQNIENKDINNQKYQSIKIIKSALDGYNIRKNYENINQEDINQEDINQEDINQEDINQEDINQENINKENINQENINNQKIDSEDLYEIVKKEDYNTIIYNNEIANNDLIFKQNKINQQIIEIDNLNNKNKNLINQLKILENRTKLDEKFLIDLQDKYNNLEYDKLKIENNILTVAEELENYKNSYSILLDEKYKLQDEINYNIKYNNETNDKLDILSTKYKELFDKYTKLDYSNKVNIFTKDIKLEIEELLNNNFKKNGKNISRNVIATNVNDIFNFLKSIQVQKKYKCI